MAASKKKPSKTKTKKPAAKKATKPTRKRKVEATALTSAQRARVLKPRDGWEDLIAQISEAWASTQELRVSGLTPSKLRTLAARAEKAGSKERKLVLEHERKLRPLADARLLAEGAAWAAVLEVNAAIKYAARTAPQLSKRFSFLGNALRAERGAASDAAGDEASAVAE